MLKTKEAWVLNENLNHAVIAELAAYMRDAQAVMATQVRAVKDGALDDFLVFNGAAYYLEQLLRP